MDCFYTFDMFQLDQSLFVFSGYIGTSDGGWLVVGAASSYQIDHLDQDVISSSIPRVVAVQYTIYSEW